jgi:hypothetical protein
MRTFWVLLDHALPVACWLSLLFPIVGLVVGHRFIRRRDPSHLRALCGAFVGFCLGCVPFVVVILVAVSTPPLGRGYQAEAGYRRAGPVIEALEHYRAQHGAYPENLMALTPAYLADASLFAPPDYNTGGEEFEYWRVDGS